MPADPLPCACASLRRAARAVTRAYALELRGTGLNPTQFTLLWALDRMGPSPQGALGELLAIDSATLTRTLAPLARRGWIRAERGADRRERRLPEAASVQRRWDVDRDAYTRHIDWTATGGHRRTRQSARQAAMTLRHLWQRLVTTAQGSNQNLALESPACSH